MTGDQNAPVLGYGDYLRFSRLVSELYGLHFPEKRRNDLEQGVRRAFAAATCQDLGEYYQLLLDPHDGAVHLQRLVNALTIGESHFFRNTGHFDALSTYVLPEIIARRQSLRTLRIWSAGCANGEEPYSLAILLRELLPDVDSWAITIIGTDVNTEALERARTGLYSEWAFREERAKRLRSRYFQPDGKRYRISEQVRRMVTFEQLNLAEDDYPSFKTNTTFMDLILCRNVTIYFAPSTTRRVVSQFYDALVDGGWLIVGHSEHSLTTYRQFQARSYPNAILYQRTGSPTILPEDWDWLTPTPAAAGAPSLRVPPVTPSVEAAPPDFQLTALSPPITPESASDVDPLAHAEELLEYGHSAQARDLLLDYVAAHPQAAAACALLGKACANLGRWDEAIRWCEKATDRDKLLLEAYYTLALVLQHQGKVEEAIRAMKKVVYLNHNSIRGHYGLADLYHHAGKLRQALKSLDNTRRLLNGQPGSKVVPGTGGITVNRLREAITRQAQQWEAEAREQ